MKTVLHNTAVLDLIKRERDGDLNPVDEEENPKKNTTEEQHNDWNNEPKPKKYKPWKPAINHAVEHVRRERKKEGLPDDPRKEIKDIEEKLVRSDLKGANVQSELDSYLDTRTFSRKIVTANWAERVGQSLVEWVNRPRAKDEDGNIKHPIKITEFFAEKGIYHRDFHILRKKYEILDQAYQYAQMVLGDIRERNMLEGKWNPTVGMFTMGQYDPNWREEQDRREAAKLKQAEATGVNVNALMAEMITPVPQTEEVRVKLEQDKKRIEDQK